MYDRIYVCHTYYHVYVSLLKEFQLPKSEWGKAEIALSTMSSDFEDLEERLLQSKMFEKVHVLPEKRFTEFEELTKYKKNYNSFIKHMVNRIIFTKKYPKLEQKYMTIPFEKYKDIYVYCDSDPIGYYLNYKHIYYHAMEDGLDCLKVFDDAHVANKGCFKMKTFLASKNILFIQNGFSKYCLDMEINDLDGIVNDCKKYKVVPRKPMEKNLTSEQKKIFLKVFIKDWDQILIQLQKISDQKKILLLTEPYHFEEATQKKIMEDIVENYCKGYALVIKPHPRDDIDYVDQFPNAVVIRGKFPIEVMNFCEGIYFDKAISIITSAMNSLEFVKEKINLGAGFWDAYEDPAKHKFD